MVALPGILRFLSTPSARRATAGHLHGPVPDWISIHALREEGDFSSHMDANRALNFYPRPPRGGRRGRSSNAQCPSKISIHALREEGDLPWLSLCSAIGKFLSTPSARRATDAPLIWATSLMYFYPRPLRGGRRFRPCSYTAPWYFYPRPLRGGRHSDL